MAGDPLFRNQETPFVPFHFAHSEIMGSGQVGRALTDIIRANVPPMNSTAAIWQISSNAVPPVVSVSKTTTRPA